MPDFLRDTTRGRRVTVFTGRLPADPFLLYTATLVPVVLGVALVARRPGELALATGLSGVAVTAQWLLGRSTPRALRQSRRAWSMLRLGVPLLYVGTTIQLIGGDALPLLALFIPVVAGAAAIGAFQGWLTASIAALIFLLPELGSLGSPAAVALRGITLAGVALVLAFGTRRIVRALELTAREARRAAAAERRRSRQIRALEEVSRLLASGGPSDAHLVTIVATVASRFGYAHVSLYLGDAADMRLVAQHGYESPIARFEPSTGVAGRVMRSRQIDLVPDVRSDPDYVDGGLEVTSLICAPLLSDGQLLGLLNVETSGGAVLDANDQTLIGIVSGRLATAIALGRDRQALAARADLFRDIGAFASEVSSSLAIDALARLIVDALAAAIPADVLAVTLLERATGRYRIEAVRGVGTEVIGREILAGDGLAGRAIRDRALVLDDELSREKLPLAARDVDAPPLAHGVGIPLVRDGVVVGAMTVARASMEARFSGLELEGLQLIASHAALAVANAMLHAEVAELAIRDPLTGLYNRRHFDEALDRLLAAHRRERLSGWRPVSAIIFDLDHFGQFNKQHGHQVGDRVLREFSDVLRGRFRAADLVARMGGEEFVVILEGAACTEAVAIAEEVRVALAQRRMPTDDGGQLHVTVSAGCAELDRRDATRETLLRTADVALFMAKRAGRDRVVAA